MRLEPLSHTDTATSQQGESKQLLSGAPLCRGAALPARYILPVTLRLVGKRRPQVYVDSITHPGMREEPIWDIMPQM